MPDYPTRLINVTKTLYSVNLTTPPAIELVPGTSRTYVVSFPKDEVIQQVQARFAAESGSQDPILMSINTTSDGALEFGVFSETVIPSIPIELIPVRSYSLL